MIVSRVSGRFKPGHVPDYVGSLFYPRIALTVNDSRIFREAFSLRLPFRCSSIRERRRHVANYQRVVILASLFTLDRWIAAIYWIKPILPNVSGSG